MNPNRSRVKRKYLFVWEHFGPIHDDRCEALAQALGSTGSVVGLQIFGKSDTYSWDEKPARSYEKKILIPQGTTANTSTPKRLVELLRACIKCRATHYFFCNYENFATLVCAALLRLSGKHVYVMNDSKFDDYRRTLWRENIKSLFYLPYEGAISSGNRSRDYLRFLGINLSRIYTNYNAQSVDRIRGLVRTAKPSPTFKSRHFSVVARLVEKKNLFITIRAYAEYVAACTAPPRMLHIAGNGPLEAQLKQLALELSIADLIVWHGFIQEAAVINLIHESLAVLLLSTEEQFGNVVIEAQALAIPVIVSTNVGARDSLVRNAINGFIVEPDNVIGTATLMGLLSSNERLWAQFSASATEFIPQGDVSSFCRAVVALSE